MTNKKNIKKKRTHHKLALNTCLL